MKLPQDFPGRILLEAAGEDTTQAVRKRIAAGTLTQIPGIGEGTRDRITEAFEELDSPAVQAKEGQESEDDESITPASQAKDVAEREAKEQQTGEGTLVNQGDGPSPEAVAAGEREAEKTGAEKNQLPNHDLTEMTPAERRAAGVMESAAERIAHSGAVYVHDPGGPYASRTAVHIPDGHIRIKVDPISSHPPVKGMRVKDDGDEYTIQEGWFTPDSRADDWLKVRSPNTGLAFIR